MSKPDLHTANPKIERMVLATLMNESWAASVVMQVLDANAFDVDEHRHIFEAAESVVDEGKGVALDTVTAALDNKALSTDATDVYTSEVVPSRDRLHDLCLILLEHQTGRRLADTVHHGEELLRQDSVDYLDVQARLQDLVSRSLPTESQRGLHKISEHYARMKDRSERAADGAGVFITTGLPTLDEQIGGGYEAGTYVAVGADSGIGKTSHALGAMRRHALRKTEDGYEAKEDNTCALFSTEMNGERLLRRVVGPMARVEPGDIRKGTLTAQEWKRLDEAKGVLDEADLFLDHCPGITVERLCQRVRRGAQLYDLDVVYIDYLQNLHSEDYFGGNKERFDYVSRTLKRTAEETGVTVCVLSQVSIPDDGDRRPDVDSLYGTTMIRNDADVVVTIYRAEHYGFERSKALDLSADRLAEFTVGKVRDKHLGSLRERTVLATWHPAYATFTDGAPEDAPF
jgi:replicative DNA helicase